VLCIDEHDTPNACKLNVFGRCAGFRILSYERESPSKFIAK
jgi:hypothetical protein